MMLGGSLFGDLEEDPFFAGHQQMQRMQGMFQVPFGFGMQGQGMPALTDSVHGNQHRQHRHRRENQLAPYPMFNHGFGVSDMFTNMSSMMSDMQRTFETTRNNPEAQCFTQSSFYSYSNTGQGTPKVYQSSSSTRTAPGGVKEVKKSERDSESGFQKMAVEHHINDRAHVIERSHNVRTGDKEENQEFVNLDEDDAHTFDREWQDKTKPYSRSLEYRHDRLARHGRTEQRALPAPEHEHEQDEKVPSYRNDHRHDDRRLRKERNSYRERD